MTDVTDDVADWLISQSTLFVDGRSIFVDSLPETTGRALLVTATPGSPAVRTYRRDPPAFLRPSFQVIARSTKPAPGADSCDPREVRAMISLAHTLLDAVANQTLTSSGPQTTIDATQAPFFLERDEVGRSIYAFNADAWRST